MAINIINENRKQATKSAVKRNRFLAKVYHHYHHGDAVFLSSHGD